MESKKEKPGEPPKDSEAGVIPEIKDYKEKYHIKMDVDHKIGGGSFGLVFRIARKSDDKVLAMKISR
jgi:hypothetical protein